MRGSRLVEQAAGAEKTVLEADVELRAVVMVI
jgi:hypothetical protein